MAEDSGKSDAPSRPDRAERLGLVRCKRSILAILFLLSSVFCPLSSAFADSIAVRKVETHFSDGAYQFSADFDIKLNFVVRQALEQGVALYFVSEFTLTHPRWYWLDETVAHSEQTFKLSYNILTRQYRITRGALYQNFASLDEVLRIIGHQPAAPVAEGLLKEGGGYISEKLFKQDDHYIAAARLRLDVTQLPKPLQVNALTGDDWNLDSDWHRWIVRPDMIARN